MGQAAAAVVVLAIASGCGSSSSGLGGGDAGVADADDMGREVVCGSSDDLRFLHQLDDLSSCTVFRGSIHVSDTGAVDLAQLSHFRAIEGSLTFFRNELLASANGLEHLRAAGKIGFNFHGRLNDVSALASLGDVPGELYFINNDVLESLHGVEGVRSVGQLTIIGNSDLRNLEGLSGLQEVVGDLEISRNPSLARVEVEAFVARLNVGGSIVVSENGP